MERTLDTDDRGHLLTEKRNRRSAALDTLSVRECVDLINSEDGTVAAAVDRAAGALAAFIGAVETRMLRAARDEAMGRLVYVGAGTSGRLGVLDAAECPPTFCTPHDMVIGIIAGGDPALRRSSEGREDEPDGSLEQFEAIELSVYDTVLGIAAGGTTPFVMGALEQGRRRGALTGLLTCAPVETPDYVDHHVVVETGPEVLTGSTRMKAGTATKLVLNTISTTLMVRLGKVRENLMVDLRATNSKLRDRAARIIATLCGRSREESLALLDAAGGSCKTAIAMHELGLDREAAEAKLCGSSGRLGEMLREAGSAGGAGAR